jgi:hypothetical protein
MGLRGIYLCKGFDELSLTGSMLFAVGFNILYHFHYGEDSYHDEDGKGTV